VDLAVGPDVHGRVAQPLLAADALGEGPRHQIDLQLARDRARPRDRRTVERLSARDERVAATERGSFLRQHDELRTIRRRARQAIGAFEVAIEVCGGGELDGSSTHCKGRAG